MSTPEAIPNQYIVVFKQHTPEEVCEQHCEWAHTTHTEAAAARVASDEPELTGVGEKFNIDTLNGYVGSFNEDLKNEIAARDEVAFVQPDYVVTTCGTVTQKPAPSWGLARLSSNHKLQGGVEWAYTYDSTAGQGTWGYILDTGILITHEDFQGRAKWGFNAVPGSANTDRNGHGTHVAGTVGGVVYGVAKKCNLVAVKVLGDNGSGSTSGIVQGIQWATRDAKANGRIKKSVANMSLGGPKNPVLDAAVAAAVKEGLTFVVAAGNSSKDACGFSPASEPSAFTVGSIDIDDKISSFSNFGKCVDIFAPGRNITSDWWEPGNKGTKTINGTSMASPHVTGLALTLIARTPGGFPNPHALTGTIIGLSNRNSRVVPPVPFGTTTLIGFNGL